VLVFSADRSAWTPGEKKQLDLKLQGRSPFVP
jgi:hypothetical protein